MEYNNIVWRKIILQLIVPSLIIHLLYFTIPILPSYFSVLEGCSLSRGGTTYHLSLTQSHLYPPMAWGKAGSRCIFSHFFQWLSSLLPIPSIHNPSSSYNHTGWNYHQWRHNCPILLLSLSLPLILNKGGRVGKLVCQKPPACCTCGRELWLPSTYGQLFIDPQLQVPTWWAGSSITGAPCTCPPNLPASPYASRLPTH